MKEFEFNKPKIFNSSDKILLAVSGGVDSMTMLDFFAKNMSKDNFAVAHCNFSLRGEDSISDMHIVEDICQKQGITLHKIVFDTYSEIKKRAKTLQEVARELRYDWFEELAQKYSYTKIATAHNANDNIETVFVNCVRGTGVRGYTGIPLVNGKIIRPLLSYTREEILDYAKANGVVWREDKSNATVKYLRNSIRHELMPVLSSRNDNFLEVMQNNIQKVSESVCFLDFCISKYSEKYVSQSNIDLVGLMNEEFSNYILFEIMQKWDFSRSVTDSICISYKNGETGKYFISRTNKALLDRGTLIISTHCDTTFDIDFSKNQKYIDFGIGKIFFEISPYNLDTELKTPKHKAIFDYDKLAENLKIRTWHTGDEFQPFGMLGKKLLSDLFIDLKLSRNEKNSTPILCNNSDIIWVVGHRTDKRYSVDKNTKNLLVCEYKAI